MRLRVDRPCRVALVCGRWQWRCLCTPEAWSYTGAASSWTVAYGQADRHVRVEHADLAPAVVIAARQAGGAVIDLDQRRNRHPVPMLTTPARSASRVASGALSGAA